MNPQLIVVAGASGFVGRALLDRLLVEFPNASILALSRSSKPSSEKRLKWVQCDLFSEASVFEALPAEVDLVYYLVHSMEPTAQLDQGSFADYDLIMADNFARACAAKKARHLIYLGGLIPDRSDLSLHLQSRLEVETVFSEYQLPYTFFRAGLIIGEKGSSFQIVLKLVKRLRVMICPAWTQTVTSPVDLNSVVRALVESAKEQRHLGRVYDLAGCAALTYLDMMRLTAQHLGLKRYFLKVNLFSLTLSRLWVSLITHTSRYLVYPLIASLKYPMVARDSHSFFPESRTRSYSDLLSGFAPRELVHAPQLRTRARRPTVRSVQRIALKGQTARTLADTYFRWLRQVTLGLIGVSAADGRLKICVFGRLSLIELVQVETDSEATRVTYLIRGGLLVRSFDLARLEFRLVLNRKFALVAIHDYAPSLPWYLYVFTQAQLHALVMWSFRSALNGGRGA